MRKKLLALILATLMISSVKSNESIDATDFNEFFFSQNSSIKSNDKTSFFICMAFLILWAVIVFGSYTFENSDSHKDRVSEAEAVLTLGRMNGLTKEGGEMIIDTLLKNDLIAKWKVKNYWNRICSKFNDKGTCSEE